MGGHNSKSTELYKDGKEFKMLKDAPVKVFGACLEPLNKEEAILIGGSQNDVVSKIMFVYSLE